MILKRLKHLAKFSGHKYYDSVDMNFSNCRVTSHLSRDQKFLLLQMWEPLTVSQYLA